MKKIFGALVLVTGLTLAASAQEKAATTTSTPSGAVYQVGQNIIHAGIGIGSPYAVAAATGADVSSIPPIHVSFEHGLKDKIGIGGLVGYTASTQTFNVPFFGEYKFKYSYIIVGARGTYHFINDEKMDIYAGAMLGYNIASASYDGPTNAFTPKPVAAGGVAFGAFGGIRYKFNDKLMAFGELGYNISWISVGLGFKI